MKHRVLSFYYSFREMSIDGAVRVMRLLALSVIARRVRPLGGHSRPIPYMTLDHLDASTNDSKFVMHR
ncbi:hypothetical protein D3C71_2017260 [compost metagenome]